ncbi:hypothetical protein PG989_012875 [Apiospora arundinis]
MVRRTTRLRHRNTMPKPLKIPAKVPEEPESKSAPLVSSRSIEFPTTTPRLSVTGVSVLGQTKTVEIDTDTETDVGTSTDPSDLDEGKATESPPGLLTDVSNYLSAHSQHEEDDASVTVVDSDAYSRTSSMEDLYGWEAELDRKLGCGMSNSVQVCKCNHFEYRRADGAKRSLLHRVFNIPNGRRASSG